MRYLGAVGLDLGNAAITSLLDPVNPQDGNTLANQDAWRPKTVIKTSDSAAITTTTLVSQLAVTISVLGVYWFTAQIGLVPSATTGIVPGVQVGGTMTTTAYRFMTVLCSNNLVANTVSGQTSGTTLSASGFSIGDLGNTAAQQCCIVSGTFTCSVAGTMTLSASRLSGTATSFLVKAGSNMHVQRT